MKLFFLVLARDEKYVDEKLEELKDLHVPHLIICGSRLSQPDVAYRQPKGKFDAINFGFELIPKDVDIVALNDVDTRIHNLTAATKHFSDKDVALVFARVSVKKGPQRSFYGLLDFIRRRIPITASGELMIVRRDVLEQVLPMGPCKAEDSYMLFKVLELKHQVVFCEDCFTETERTNTPEKEEIYKRKTVCGIYQALGQTNPSILIRVFYILLPFASPLLLISGRNGYYWMKGILLGLTDYLRGDRTGIWQQTYMTFGCPQESKFLNIPGAALGITLILAVAKDIFEIHRNGSLFET